MPDKAILGDKDIGDILVTRPGTSRAGIPVSEPVPTKTYIKSRIGQCPISRLRVGKYRKRTI